MSDLVGSVKFMTDPHSFDDILEARRQAVSLTSPSASASASASPPINISSTPDTGADTSSDADPDGLVRRKEALETLEITGDQLKCAYDRVREGQKHGVRVWTAVALTVLTVVVAALLVILGIVMFHAGLDISFDRGADRGTQ